jgi:hypothetical protein
MALALTRDGTRLLTATATGPIASGDLVAFIRSEWPNMPPDGGVLFDGRLASVRLSAEEVRLLVSETARHRGLARLAIVTDHDLEYGLARMYEIQAAEYATVRVFRAIEEATDWLGPSGGMQAPTVTG